ncbi:hypothetical protein DL770_005920 [Monosporascus sp. CRB-9-2]|nr:hypothetical protein DL770_005920 [Monosporascus sp. CRB-9-2]
MAKHWAFFATVAPFAAAAGSLDDLSNNLATDLGPLLALFGENMTKQYLSESTSFVDYFIFAMAPIGIITAIVSAIRVCGSAALRAFIGRAQEGNGTVEAELCTSTSRDVCELFNNGSITRTLGKSNILEIIYISGETSAKEDMGIFLFQDYLQSLDDNSEWVEDKPHAVFSRLRRPDPESPEERYGKEPLHTVPNPNLSINVGIVKSGMRYFYFLAALGLVLQTGVMVMACVLSLHQQWTSDGKPESRMDVKWVISDNPSPILYVVGTTCLCVGMFWCAALIGQITDEYSYCRKDSPQRQSRLFWLQPGNLRVGDQTFDPFAYSEKLKDPKSRLSKYTVSKKRNSPSQLHTWGAIIFSLGGYIVQFIGLRGMTAYVSIAQLGITIIMSFFRGCLRMRRLKTDDNEVHKILDEVVGHELDWLALKIASADGDRAENINHGNNSSLPPDSLQRADSKQSQSLPEPRLTENIVRCRTRLARLTGHGSLQPPCCQRWDDDQIKVRVQARRLADAIGQAAEVLLGERKDPKQFRVTLSRWQEWASDGPLTLTPRGLEGVSQNRSTLDSAELEGVLGPWLWQLVERQTQDANRSPDANGNTATPAELKERAKASEQTKILGAEQIQKARIISACIPDEGGQQRISEGEMGLWLGKNSVNLSEVILIPNRERDCNSFTLWKKGPKGWSPSGNARGDSQQYQWIFGWNAALPSISPSWSSKSKEGIRILFIHTLSSLLSECSKELFATAIASIADSSGVQINTIPEEASGQLRWVNGQINDIATAFVTSGLGSRTDALLCTVPALQAKLRYPDERAVADAARHYRKKHEWGRAESLLKATCVHYEQRLGEELRRPAADSHHTCPKDDFFGALVSLGELYRWSFIRQGNDRSNFGYNGIKWMLRKYGLGELNPKPAEEVAQGIREILDRYYQVTLQVSRDRGQEKEFQVEWHPHDSTQVEADGKLVNAIEKRNRATALYCLCSVTTEALNSDQQAALALAARNGWHEVVRAVLDLNAFADSQDRQGRTALSYSAEGGNEAITKTLLENGLFPDKADWENHTPLSRAAQNGHEAVVKLLLETGKVDVNLKDKTYDRTPLSWASQNGNEAVVKLLLEAGKVDVNLADETYYRTPLSWASQHGYEAVVKLLLKTGKVDENSKDNFGRTPLSWASQNGHEAVVKLLLETGKVDEDSKDNSGQTPLSWASRNGHEAVVKLLLETGKVDVDLEDSRGRTPLWWASQNEHKAVTELLRTVMKAKLEELGEWDAWWEELLNRTPENIVRLFDPESEETPLPEPNYPSLGDVNKDAKLPADLEKDEMTKYKNFLQIHQFEKQRYDS